MDVAAYCLTLLCGAAALALTGYGVFNDLKNNSLPRSLDEWALTIGLALAGWAMTVTALKAITS